jgi:hypothetical protein
MREEMPGESCYLRFRRDDANADAARAKSVFFKRGHAANNACALQDSADAGLVNSATTLRR